MTGRAWQLRVASAIGIAVSVAFGIRANRSGACGKPWIFFDLGNTIVVANPKSETRYVPGAHDYVRGLRKRGYHVGLISNVPEKWGITRAEKIHVLKKIVSETWTKDPTAEAMDWSDFPDSSIFIPLRDLDRKPAPFVYQSALAHVFLEEGRSDCPVYFQGEDPKEVKAAENLGMKGYVALRAGEAPFLPYDQVKSE